MTRLNLLVALFAAPLSALIVQDDSAPEAGKRVIHLGPGTYTVGPGGGITITGVMRCRFENCRIENGELIS